MIGRERGHRERGREKGKEERRGVAEKEKESEGRMRK
jgi:hypothetical protein